MKERPEIVVIGCGNPYAGDDAAGIAVVEALQKSAPTELCLRLMHDLGAAFLCDAHERASIVIIVDAVKSGAPIGTLHFCRFPSNSVVARSSQRVSTHSLGLEKEIALASTCGECPKVFLLGIEIGDHCNGESLSSPVTVAVEKAVVNFADFCASARWQPNPG